MTRYIGGMMLCDVLTDAAGNGLGGRDVGLFRDQALTNRETDLLTLDGQATQVARTDTQGRIEQVRFPDDGTPFLWAAVLDAATGQPIPPGQVMLAHTALSEALSKAISAMPLSDIGVRVPSLIDGKVPSAFLPSNTVEHTADIQPALNDLRASGGGDLVVAPGTHRLLDTLKIYSGTRLIASRGAKFVRGYAGMTAMCVLWPDSEQGGYGGVHDVSIQGGDWDCGSREFPADNCSGFAFAHGQSIHFSDMYIHHVFRWHGIAPHGSRDVTIERVRFSDWTTDRATGSECVQIDSPLSSGSFSFYGPWDSTMCQGVTVRDCSGRSVFDGVGSHSGPGDGTKHKGISVLNCDFTGATNDSFRAREWGGSSRIVGNQGTIRLSGAGGGNGGVIVTGNAGSAITVEAGAGNVQVHDNLINGTWTP